MPTYQKNITYRGGFYNNKVVGGVNDRVYSAEDMRMPFDTVFSDGVMPVSDGTAGDTLKVTAAGGMKVQVAAGRAKLGGAWFHNKEPFVITLDNAGSTARLDCVIIRNDDSDAVRAPQIYVKSVAASAGFSVSNLERTDEVYEICVAIVNVKAAAQSISNSDITDTRTHGALCQTMTGVGGIITRTYTNTYFTEEAGMQEIPVGIPQFNYEYDTLKVIVEGIVFSPSRYDVEESERITMHEPIPLAGTRVDFEVVRNVNAGVSSDVVKDYIKIQTQFDSIKKTLEHHYYCNGSTDNVEITKLCTSLISGTNYGSVKLVVHGNFGATSAYSGSGTESSPYIWFRVGAGGETNRRVFVDFTDCGQISINCLDNSYNTIFFGFHCDIIGANVVATGGANITMFSTVAKTISNATNCRFWVTSKTGYIARGGTFRDCRVSLTTSGENACAFNVLKGGLLRLFGGEYYAYAPTDGNYWSTVVYVNSGQTDSTNGAVVNTYSIVCPTVARSGYVQSYAINCLTNDGRCSFRDTITMLTVDATGQNIAGTIKQNLSGTI